MENQSLPESLSTASEKSGMPPGSLVHVGEVHAAECRITLINYNASIFEEREIDSIGELHAYKNSDTVTWINIDGLQDVSVVADLGRSFDIHPLVLEDILNTHQRPKFEEHDDYLYFVFKALILDNQYPYAIKQEQISILLLQNFIFTFKEKKSGVFDPIHTRLKNTHSNIRNYNTDYLAYVIIDTIVDQYFAMEDTVDEIIEPLEYELLSNPTSHTLAILLNIKRELIIGKRSVVPLRELLAAILRSNSPLIQRETRHYFTDVYDHALRVIDTMDTNREIINSLHDIYLTSISNKLNETMKVLTVFASIFIPLTFITGVYGMNFEYMPELAWKWAYPTLWGVFIGLLVGLLVFFKKKKWI